MQGGGHGRRTAATEAATAATPPPPKIPDGEERRTTRAEGRSAREKGRKNSVAREQPADRFCSDERVMDIKWVHGTHRQINSISNTGPAAFREQRFNKYATARPTRTIRNIKRSFVSLSLFPLFPLFLFFLSVSPCVSLSLDVPLRFARNSVDKYLARNRSFSRTRVIIFPCLSRPFHSPLLFFFFREVSLKIKRKESIRGGEVKIVRRQNYFPTELISKRGKFRVARENL